MKLNILLIDDDPDEFDIFSKALENLKYSFVFRYARDTEEALGVMADFVPDFIFSDYNMPKEDGLAFLRRLKRSNFSNIAFVLYSTTINKELQEKANSLGASYWLKKPNSLAELAEKLKNVFILFSKF
ncbi:MAG TPA: response regulator [Puia sp.]|nr:response regulator [Puia sp.]